MRDLRSFLDAAGGAVFRPAQALSVVYEITALQHALEAQGQHPVVCVERALLADGRHSPIGVVCNLTASRELTARALGFSDHRSAARSFAEGLGRPIAPVVLGRGEAPVQQRVLQGDACDLGELPVLRQHTLDPGPYLTAAHVTTFDPDTGIDNTAIQRCWVKGPRSTSYYPYADSHNDINLRKFWARGQACPVALWIGHHPAVSIAAQAKLGYPESHWNAVGGIIGEPLRLAPSVTHADRILVPADAELVIEGFAPPGALAADGPFGEFTGYMGPQILAPSIEVTAITRRENALYHDYGSGLSDMLVPDNMAMEGKLFELLRGVAPSVANVHVPVSGRRFHAYIQLCRPAPEEPRAALAAALQYRRIKMALAVDEDVDIFSEGEMLWALATRVQWDRDTLTLAEMPCSLDPSWPAGARGIAKLGIDATLPVARRAGSPRPFAPRALAPEAALEGARRLLASADASRWPRA
ncbi:MAG: UbiD family decarboxylase [Burkholderiales bacterium]|nr:UbiD family decarboxylase [Burkholderiales bacterium]